MTPKKWIAAARVLAPGNASVVAAVRLALEQPGEYVKVHARTLEERGVRSPIPTLPFIALLDALDDARLVALIDWKSATDDVVFLMRKLKKKLSWRWTKTYDEDDLDDLSMDRLLKAIAVEASAHDLALVNIDTTSDQYAIALIELARVSKVVKAMKATGHPVHVVVPRALAKPKPPPKRVRLGTPMAKWASGAGDGSNTSRYFFHRERLRSLWTRRWDTAFDVMEGPAWTYSMKQDRREVGSRAKLERAYVSFIEQLHRDGWLQFTLPEASKELVAHYAARSKKTKKKRKRS